MIFDDWRERLFAFIGGCVKKSGGIPEAIGGTRNHVHLLIGLGATRLMSDVIKDVKVASSRWVHTEIGSRLFSWQRGYGGFTVSPSQTEQVKRYVLNQDEHHRKKTFEEEYLDMLKMAGINYEDKYLW